VTEDDRARPASALVEFPRRRTAGTRNSARATLHLAQSRRRSPRIRLRSQARNHSRAFFPGVSTPPLLSFDKTHLLQTIIDATCVLVDLGYTLLTSDCDTAGAVKAPSWLEVLALISTIITTLFLVEIPLTLWSLGFEFYSPRGRFPHATLHIFDAVIIVTTFVLEVVLRGRERELAGLLIILRLWRLLKLVGGELLLDANRNDSVAYT